MRTLTAAVAVILLGVAASGYIGASGATTKRATFTTRLLTNRYLDIGHAGASVGDSTIRRWRLSDREGTAVGTEHEVCRWTSSTMSVCMVVFNLPFGTLALEGLVGSGLPLAITGGTGGYVGAHGQALMRGRVVTLVFD